MADAFVLSFMDAKVGFDYSFNGISNYARLFQDTTFEPIYQDTEKPGLLRWRWTR